MPFDVEVIEDYELKSQEKLNKKTGTEIVEPASQNYLDNEAITYFYFDEYSRVLNNATKFYRLVYLFLFETGARIEEARAVKYKDIDMDTNKIKMKTLKQRSPNKGRILPISDKLKAFVLQHQLENRLNKEDFVFAKSTGGKSITQQAVDAQMKRDCEKMGIDREKGHCHTWRHSRAIQLLDSGEVNIVQLQLFLGHTSINSTLMYLKYSNQHLNQAIRAGNKAINLI
jgi:integrase